MPDTTQMNAIVALRKRFRARLSAAIRLVRAYRFVTELEPLQSGGPDSFSEAAAVFWNWRRALQNRDVDGALDEVERTWPLLEACRQRVVSRDAMIEAYRVRWACENAPLDHQTSTTWPASIVCCPCPRVRRVSTSMC